MRIVIQTWRASLRSPRAIFSRVRYILLTGSLSLGIYLVSRAEPTGKVSSLQPLFPEARGLLWCRRRDRFVRPGDLCETNGSVRLKRSARFAKWETSLVATGALRTNDRTCCEHNNHRSCKNYPL